MFPTLFLALSLGLGVAQADDVDTGDTGILDTGDTGLVDDDETHRMPRLSPRKTHLFVSAGGDILIHSSRDLPPGHRIRFLPPRWIVEVVSETEVHMLDIPTRKATPRVWGTGDILPCEEGNSNYFYVNWTSGSGELESQDGLHFCTDVLQANKAR